MPHLIASRLLFLTVLAVSALPGTALACAGNDINCEWISAVLATQNLDLAAFDRSVAAAHVALEASPSPSPSERARVLLLDGISAAMMGDNSAATEAFRAARRLDPSATLPQEAFAPDNPVTRLYAAAAPGPSGPLVLADTPGNSPLVTSETGRHLEEPSRPALRAPLLIGAAASGALSGGLLALSRGVEEVQPGASSRDYTEDVATALSREHGLRAGAGGAALVGAGLLTVGLTVAW